MDGFGSDGSFYVALKQDWLDTFSLECEGRGGSYEVYGCNKGSKYIIRGTINYCLKYIPLIPLSSPKRILLTLEFRYIVPFSGAVNHKTTVVTVHITCFKI
jgi:hypothetical protein